MAKVVLIWNEHPTEVVAGFHARKVAEILRGKKYRHKVIVKKVPVAETNYGIVRKYSPIEAVQQLIELKDSYEFAQEAARENKAICFNFHASSPSIMGAAAWQKPGNFEVGEFSPLQPGYPTEIAFQRNRNANHYLIELPGVNLPLKRKIRRKREEQRKAVFLANNLSNTYPSHLEKRLNPTYHLYRMPLADKRQQKYLHPAISEKIAQAIHERITRK